MEFWYPISIFSHILAFVVIEIFIFTVFTCSSFIGWDGDFKAKLFTVLKWSSVPIVELILALFSLHVPLTIFLYLCLFIFVAVVCILPEKGATKDTTDTTTSTAL